MFLGFTLQVDAFNQKEGCRQVVEAGKRFRCAFTCLNKDIGFQVSFAKIEENKSYRLHVLRELVLGLQVA